MKLHKGKLLLMFQKYLILIFILIFNTKVYSEPLVNSDWIEDKICKKGYIVLELNRSKNNYQISHIPCSVYTNFYDSGWRVSRNDIPLAMPEVEHLVEVIKNHGISNSHHVIISASGTGKYDAAEAAAIYFTFKYLGHEKVSILDGGFKEWKKKWDRDLETGFKKVNKGNFKAYVNENILANKSDVLKLIDKKGYLIDARSTDMYLGINMSFPALRNGTISNSVNVPNEWLLKNDTLYFQDKEKLELIYNYSGIKKKEGIISFCNAGLESALSWFVMSELLNFPNNKLYEASIAEWSKNENLPMEQRFEILDQKSYLNGDDGFSMKPSN